MVRKTRLEERIKALSGGNSGRVEMANANVSMVKGAVRHAGPDSSDVIPELGARIVVNISCVHVPAFCETTGAAYKNGYNTRKYQTIGQIPVGTDIPVRTAVDDLLKTVTKEGPERVYFAAVEMNGSGVRFYGDVCLVLTPNPSLDGTIVLESNSYDLARPPLTATGTSVTQTPALMEALRDMAGTWGEDVPEMATLKTFALRTVTERRLTTGQISEAVLQDEDYLEALEDRKLRSHCAAGGPGVRRRCYCRSYDRRARDRWPMPILSRTPVAQLPAKRLRGSIKT